MTFELYGPASYKKQSGDAIRAAYRQIHDKLVSATGVESVAFNDGAHPMGSDDEEFFWILGKPRPSNRNDLPMALQYVVDPDYLKVMQIPLKRGRFFTMADNEHAPAVAVIDETLAAKYFPDQDPIGQYLDLNLNPSDPDKVPNPQIIGVVGHVNQWGLDRDAASPLHSQMYIPFAQIPDKDLQRGGLGTDVFLRQQGPGSTSLQALHKRVLEFNSGLIVNNPENMEATVAESVAAKRFTMILLGVFAAFALVLASIGIYGVLSYTVGQRTKEIGVRMALGAQRAHVLQMVLRDGAWMILAGVIIGAFVALFVTRLMSSLLFGVKPTDPLTFLSVAGLLSAIALLACYVPAHRAMQVDPIEALRHE